MSVMASHWTKIKDLFLSDKEEFLLTTVDKGCSRHQLDKPTDDESTTGGGISSKTRRHSADKTRSL